MGKIGKQRCQKTTQGKAAASGAPLDPPSLDAAFLCPDGLPPLYPRPPCWPVDAKLKRKYSEILRLPPFLVPGEQQQIPDMANRHFQYLSKINDNPNDTRPASERAAELCGPSCWDPFHLGSDPTPCTAGEFQSRMTKEVFGELGFHFARPYEVPQTPIPTFCGKCNKECTSECGRCGEKYCSRKCLKNDWSKHRRICDMVYENNNLATLFSQFEMKETLTNEELQIAWGMKPEKKVLSMKICAACSRTLPKNQFSKKQWQLKQCRRCKGVLPTTRRRLHPHHYHMLMLKTQIKIFSNSHHQLMMMNALSAAYVYR